MRSASRIVPVGPYERTAWPSVGLYREYLFTCRYVALAAVGVEGASDVGCAVADSVTYGDVGASAAGGVGVGGGSGTVDLDGIRAVGRLIAGACGSDISGVVDGELGDDGTGISAGAVGGVDECGAVDSVRDDGSGVDGVSGLAVGEGTSCGGAGDARERVKEPVVTGVAVGPRGGLSIGRGPNYSRNRENRERKKAAKKNRRQAASAGTQCVGSPSRVPEWRRGAGPDKVVGGSFSLVSEDVKRGLQESYAAKLKAENEVAVARAEQALQVVKARDVDQHVKAQRAKSLMMTEKCLVAVEKAHASLAATGNVDLGGTARTVVTQGSSISPSSSVSAKAMKELEEEVTRLRALIEKTGVPDVDPKLYDKYSWTDNSENYRLLEKMYDGDFGTNNADAASGRFNLILPSY